MEGCRGDTEALEKAVWTHVKARRAGTTTVVTDDTAEKPRRAELLAEAKRLRELARELLEKARELEEAAGK